ncbi:MAG: hypothetical protein E2581_26525 [Pseudomonas sp.]|uniref:hypothetical protein n=1 Tax=Pseudomonas sp. TaxID=306 RepID=UPI001DCDA0A2|nr:hypothetical protein [Pseudomonas sp.]MPT02008.1 hypothetical protein [Pseudomonas sp.]
MRYLLLALTCYGATYYLVGLTIQGQLANIADGLSHRPDAPTPAQYLREVRHQARRAHRHYTLLAGSVLALGCCLVVSWAS